MAFKDYGLSRREMLRLGATGLIGGSVSGWFPRLASALADAPGRRRQCILLWMGGGPSQTDTFDMKPGHANGGAFKEVPTSVPGLRFSEHLPQLAKQADRLAVVRSLKTKEGDHSRATHLVRTGHAPGEPVRYPSIACSLAKELADGRSSLPKCVSVTPPVQLSPPAFGPGFLGPQFAPAIVGETRGAAPQGDGAEGFARLELENLELPPGVDAGRAARRLELWNSLQHDFLANRGARAYQAHDTLYRQAVDMMAGEARTAFDLTREKPAVREAYGRGRFGQGCLLARRLVERGVPFVEVALGDFAGWDTHNDGFTQIERLSAELDAGWATLMRELDERGLLETTTILWIGEFGRTPAINQMAGRDHFPAAWSCVFAGGGIQGGQAFGRTSADGMSIEQDETNVSDVLATLCSAVGVDPSLENIADGGRPIRIVEGTPIRRLLV